MPARSAETAIATRRSIRAFLPKPVARADIERLLELGARAPSGTNMQPWQAVVLTGEALSDFCDRLQAFIRSGEDTKPQYSYYPPQFREPYLARRRKVGWDLYGALGIVKGDSERMAAQHMRNFRFFDAPVGMLFTIDAELELGSWLDYGMFLENIMVGARGMGLDTCAQAAFVRYHAQIRAILAIPEDCHLVCGMALGYADPTAPENSFVTEREQVSGFTRFIDRLP